MKNSLCLICLMAAAFASMPPTLFAQPIRVEEVPIQFPQTTPFGLPVLVDIENFIIDGKDETKGATWVMDYEKPLRDNIGLFVASLFEAPVYSKDQGGFGKKGGVILQANIAGSTTGDVGFVSNDITTTVYMKWVFLSNQDSSELLSIRSKGEHTSNQGNAFTGKKIAKNRMEMAVRTAYLDAHAQFQREVPYIAKWVAIIDKVKSEDIAFFANEENLRVTDKNGNSLLSLSALYDNLPMGRYFIAKGLTAGHRNTKGTTPLMIAVAKGHADFVDMLLTEPGSGLGQEEVIQAIVVAEKVGSTTVAAKLRGSKNAPPPPETVSANQMTTDLNSLHPLKDLVRPFFFPEEATSYIKFKELQERSIGLLGSDTDKSTGLTTTVAGKIMLNKGHLASVVNVEGPGLSGKTRFEYVNRVITPRWEDAMPKSQIVFIDQSGNALVNLNAKKDSATALIDSNVRYEAAFGEFGKLTSLVVTDLNEGGISRKLHVKSYTYKVGYLFDRITIMRKDKELMGVSSENGFRLDNFGKLSFNDFTGVSLNGKSFARMPDGNWQSRFAVDFELSTISPW